MVLEYEFDDCHRSPSILWIAGLLSPSLSLVLKSAYGMRRMHENMITDSFESKRCRLDDCHGGPSFLWKVRPPSPSFIPPLSLLCR